MASLFFGATVGNAVAQATEPVGATGLDARADREAALCRQLTAQWQETQAIPSTVHIGGVSRPIMDLGLHGVIDDGRDITGPMQDAIRTQIGINPAPIFFLRPNVDETVYRRFDRVSLAVAGSFLCGYGARIEATNPQRLALGITADGVGVYGLELIGPPETVADWPERRRDQQGGGMPSKFPKGNARQFGTNASHFVSSRTSDIILRDVTTIGAMRGGVRLFRVRNALVEGSCFRRSHSDGIHVVKASRDVTVRDNAVLETGDDCISVVTYDRTDSPRTVSGILIKNNLCHGSRTRGLTVVGGEDIAITGNEVRDTLLAGILLLSTHRFNTYPVRRITVNDNLIDGPSLTTNFCNTCGAITVHAAPDKPVEDVYIADDNRVIKRQSGAPVRPAGGCAAWRHG